MRYRFWFHYHKEASRRFGRNKLTVHYRNVCHLVDQVVCLVPVETHNRDQQPRCVLRGWVDADKFQITEKDGMTVAVIG